MAFDVTRSIVPVPEGARENGLMYSLAPRQDLGIVSCIVHFGYKQMVTPFPLAVNNGSEKAIL